MNATTKPEQATTKPEQATEVIENTIITPEITDASHVVQKRKRPQVAPPEIKTSRKRPQVAPPEIKTTLKTEDTGKIFEKAICLAYNTEYVGKYKYSVEKAEVIKERLKKLPELFPPCLHTAKKGARYDFTATEDATKHLSAKTTKKGCGKVAPQVVGQAQPQKFCEVVGIEYKDNTSLKEYIQTNIASILSLLESYTFDCPNIYYNEETDVIQFIQLLSPVDWTKYTYKWTCDWTKWNNSSTLKICNGEKETALVEFQFHTKSRTNMAIRWSYENFLQLFKDHLSIIVL